MLSTAEKIIDQARKHTRHLGLKAQIISREIESLEQLAARAGKSKAAAETPHLLHQLTELKRQLIEYSAQAFLIERTTLKELQQVAEAARENDD